MFDFDLNNVEEVQLIPAGVIVKARLNLKPGDVENEPYLKASKNGGKYLDCEFTVIEGQFMKRKIFHKLGIEGDKIWLEMSRRIIKNLIESANGIARNDKSPEAEAKRKITSFADLDGLEVLIKVGIEQGGEYEDKNRVAGVITAESPIYKQMMYIPWNEDKIPF